MNKLYATYNVDYEVFKNGKNKIKGIILKNVSNISGRSFQEVTQRIALHEKVNMIYITVLYYTYVNGYDRKITQEVKEA